MSEIRPALEERKVAAVRSFLREHFHAWDVTDKFDFETTAQRYTVGPGTPEMHTLIVPKETFDSIDWFSLLNDQLIER
jgi:hypothetical protein